PNTTTGDTFSIGTSSRVSVFCVTFRRSSVLRTTVSCCVTYNVDMSWLLLDSLTFAAAVGPFRAADRYREHYSPYSVANTPLQDAGACAGGCVRQRPSLASGRAVPA